MLQVCIEGIVRVLIVPRSSCWALPIRGGAVVIIGTQCTAFSGGKSDRQVRDYELEEIARTQGWAVRPSLDGHLHLFCHPDAEDVFTRFLNEGLPLESSLLNAGSIVVDWIQKSRGTGALTKERVRKEEVHEILSWTFLRHRIASNLVYYDIKRGENDALWQAVERALQHEMCAQKTLKRAATPTSSHSTPICHPPLAECSPMFRWRGTGNRLPSFPIWQIGPPETSTCKIDPLDNILQATRETMHRAYFVSSGQWVHLSRSHGFGFLA